jgi:assimilatory nitrate reductase catalytic subunit
VPVSPQVCNCFNVREDAITACLQRLPDDAPQARLAALQGALRCGTQCGSCLPALRRMVQTVVPGSPVSNAVKEAT